MNYIPDFEQIKKDITREINLMQREKEVAKKEEQLKAAEKKITGSYTQEEYNKMSDEDYYNVVLNK